MQKTTVKLSLVFACATLLASGAALGFNPQPDPPGRHGAVAGAPVHTAFNPQPDPPGKHGVTNCPQVDVAKRDAASGLPSGKRTTGTELNVAGSASSGGEAQACGFEQHK
jgi:hypothetical protein